MGSKNCPETPRQKMINMMYIVLTALLALNVAAEVLESFRVVNSSLLQTLDAVEMQNAQMYLSFDQAYAENPTKVKDWKEKADAVKQQSKEMVDYVSTLKDELVKYSGSKPVNGDNELTAEDYSHVTIEGDTLEIGKVDDLNGPSEFLITQARASELKQKIEAYRAFLIETLGDDNEELKSTILSELKTADPKGNLKSGKEKMSWESEHFENKPLIAVLTLLSKIQIDVKNSESNVVKYLYAEIDAGSFKFNRLGAMVLPNSNVVLMGDEYKADVILAAEDTTQAPEIIINGRSAEVKDGKATYLGATDKAGTFKWSGLIKYKTPGGIIKSYPFEEEYQVVQPNVTMSATKMNVFYKGLKNPFEVSGGAIPSENLSVTMTNGKITRSGTDYLIEPEELDEQGRKTKVTVYADINGERRLIGTTNWRVKKVPDPVAQVAQSSGGNIRKEVLAIQDGVAAVLKDFDFEFKYTVTEFTLETPGAGGFTNRYPARGNRFTQEQKTALSRVNVNTRIYIGDIKAVGDDGTTRDLDPITFMIK
ncbi:gliding motility protein GldM [Maribellus sediminis]|uniref:type IX secretion system motor protein PorM/GldM n=1 Tax=Maribellus sediminis TaxID=2696285 RepID=UPI0023F78797|nr:gliding motility protein GldM [Maribellus sediminis]